jgi:hypothetical protein
MQEADETKKFVSREQIPLVLPLSVLRQTILNIRMATAGVLIGYYFSVQKQQNEDIKLVMDLATAPETTKKLMGGAVAKIYWQQKRIPEDVYLAVIRFANDSNDTVFQKTVNAGAVEAVKQQPELKTAITKALVGLPVRLYFHIRDEADRGDAERVRQLLEASAFDGGTIIVPGIEKVSGVQTRSLLKCFKQTECDTTGVKLVGLFKANGVQIELSNQSAAYGQSTSIRPNHFEVWFAPGSLGNVSG